MDEKKKKKKKENQIKSDNTNKIKQNQTKPNLEVMLDKSKQSTPAAPITEYPTTSVPILLSSPFLLPLLCFPFHFLLFLLFFFLSLFPSLHHWPSFHTVGILWRARRARKREKIRKEIENRGKEKEYNKGEEREKEREKETEKKDDLTQFLSMFCLLVWTQHQPHLFFPPQSRFQWSKRGGSEEGRRKEEKKEEKEDLGFGVSLVGGGGVGWTGLFFFFSFSLLCWVIIYR